MARLTSTLNPKFCSISFRRGEADASSKRCWLRLDRCSKIMGVAGKGFWAKGVRHFGVTED